MANHTQGTWIASESGETGYPNVETETINICEMYGCREEDYINAQLIAAAPELLKALEDIQTQLKAAWGCAHYEEIRIAMHTARAAIARAKGE